MLTVPYRVCAAALFQARAAREVGGRTEDAELSPKSGDAHDWVLLLLRATGTTPSRFLAGHEQEGEVEQQLPDHGHYGQHRDTAACSNRFIHPE